MKKIAVSIVMVLASVLMFSSFASAAWVMNLTPDFVLVRETDVLVRTVTKTGAYRYDKFPKTEKEFLATVLSAQASGQKILMDVTGGNVLGVGVSK